MADLSSLYRHTRTLQADVVIPFPRVARFSSYSANWIVQLHTPSALLIGEIFRLELGVSDFHSSFVCFTMDWALPVLGVETMPKGQSPAPAKEDKFKGFINVDLTDQDRSAIDAAMTKFPLANAVQELADCGKLSVSYNHQTKKYNCAVTFAGNEHEGWCISSFASTPQKAIAVTYYKVSNYYDALETLKTARSLADFG